MARGAIPSSRAPLAVIGSTAAASGFCPGPLRAPGAALVPGDNPVTRTRLGRFTPHFDDTATALAANQSVTLDIPVGRPRDVVTVHKDAVLNRKGKTLVFVLVDGKAQIRPVRLGEAVGGRFEVLKGLIIGDLVVVRGNERLLPGQEIRIKGTS